MKKEAKLIFQPRHSLLDDFESKSYVKNNGMHGFMTLFYMVGFYYLTVDPIVKYKKGEKFNYLFKHGYPEFIYILPRLFIWSYSILINQKYIRSFYVYLGCQLTLFVYSIYYVKINNYSELQNGFIASSVVIFSMKMHSYYIDCLSPSLNDFTHFLFTPTLIYDAHYPRSGDIRWSYVIKKTITVFFFMAIAHRVGIEQVYPYLYGEDLFDGIYTKVFPITIICFVCFFMIFENFLNILAELTHFADREFYHDWWNSTNYAEFNVKWNRPVHLFLFKHVYQDLLSRKVSKKMAYLGTFVVSSILHEYVMALARLQMTPIITGFMLLQFPLMFMFKGLNGKRAGGFLFWFFMIQGVSIMLNLYIRY